MMNLKLTVWESHEILIYNMSTDLLDVQLPLSLPPLESKCSYIFKIQPKMKKKIVKPYSTQSPPLRPFLRSPPRPPPTAIPSRLVLGETPAAEAALFKASGNTSSAATTPRWSTICSQQSGTCLRTLNMNRFTEIKVNTKGIDASIAKNVKG